MILLNAVGIGHDFGRHPRRAGEDSTPAVSWGSREQGRRERVEGQAEVSDELRARVVIWPPLRLARVRCERGSVRVVLPPRIPSTEQLWEGEVRVIGLDVHRSFAVVAFLDGERAHHEVRVELTRDAVIAFGRQLRPDDEVVIEATVNTGRIVRLLAPFVHRVAIANPLQVRAIAHAKTKTDKIDAAVLAKLHARGFLPEVWMPDQVTETLRCPIAQRAQVVQQMTRTKNRLHSVLHANLMPPFECELFSMTGRDRLKGGGSGGWSKRASCAALSESTVSLEGAVRCGGSNFQHHMRSPRRPPHLLPRGPAEISSPIDLATLRRGNVAAGPKRV
jgi:Transposase